MQNSIFKEFSKNGFVILPYSFCRILGVQKTAILAHIISEYHYAVKNKLNYENDFLTSLSRMGYYLCLPMEELMLILNELEELGFIDVYDSSIEFTKHISVYPEKIIEVKHSLEAKYMLDSWDSGLKNAQNPINRATNFSDTTNKIKQFIDERLKGTEQIPLVVYSYLNSIITTYEEEHKKSILEISDFWQWLNNQLQDSKLFIESIVNGIEKICSK